MAPLSKLAARMWHYQRYLGLFLVIIGTPIFCFVPSSDTIGSEFPLMIGLFTIFFSTEKIEDERSVQIRTTSLYIAFVFAYTIKLVTSTLYTWALIPFQLTEINHFIILVFALAVAIYFLRFRFIKA